LVSHRWKPWLPGSLWWHRIRAASADTPTIAMSGW
jgi:hypothetical protein